MELYMILAFDS